MNKFKKVIRHLTTNQVALVELYIVAILGLAFMLTTVITLHNYKDQKAQYNSEIIQRNQIEQRMLNKIALLEEDIKNADVNYQKLLALYYNPNTYKDSSLDTRDFKSFMDYRTITNTASKQYQLQKKAITNKYGIRCVEQLPLVAIGTGWNIDVGSKIHVICANGNSFYALVGDIKADRDTLVDNKTSITNKCRCEFIVQTERLPQSIRSSGNISNLKEYHGYVVNIIPVTE